MRSAAGMREYIDGRTERRNGGRTERRNEKREPGAGWKAHPRFGSVVPAPLTSDAAARAVTRPGRRRRRAGPPQSPAEKANREAAGPKLERAPGSLLPIRGSLT